jgi:hypothetical protein
MILSEARQFFGAQQHFFENNCMNLNHAKEEESVSFLLLLQSISESRKTFK